MFADKPVIATIAVRDLAVASSFYEGTLGLKPAPVPDDPEAIVYLSGNTALLVYRSEFAGTSQATSASWGVGDDFDDVLEELRSKGVSFEHYDLPGTTREGDTHHLGELKAAWFKDPDGNILSMANQSM